MRHGQLEDRLEVKLARRGLDGVLVDPSVLVGHVSDVGSGEGNRPDVQRQRMLCSGQGNRADVRACKDYHYHYHYH